MWAQCISRGHTPLWRSWSWGEHARLESVTLSQKDQELSRAATQKSSAAVKRQVHIIEGKVYTAAVKRQVHIIEGKVYTALDCAEKEPSRWVLDTGTRITCQRCRAAFASIDDNTMGTVKFADESVVDIEGVGTIL
jgi:hypothetical protein